MRDITSTLIGQGLRIGIVRGRFNEVVGSAMLTACRARLLELGVSDSDITVVAVPGALEIPFALQQLALSKRFDALVALGAVIREIADSAYLCPTHDLDVLNVLAAHAARADNPVPKL